MYIYNIYVCFSGCYKLELCGAQIESFGSVTKFSIAVRASYSRLFWVRSRLDVDGPRRTDRLSLVVLSAAFCIFHGVNLSGRIWDFFFSRGLDP